MGWIGALASLSILATSVNSTKTLNLRRSLQVAPSQIYDGEDRVGTIDSTEAECIVGGAKDETNEAVAWTEFNFYYAIHATAALDQEKEDDLQSLLYMMIQTAILWCTIPEPIPVEVSGTGGKGFRQLLESKECKYDVKHKIEMEKSSTNQN